MRVLAQQLADVVGVQPATLGHGNLQSIRRGLHCLDLLAGGDHALIEDRAFLGRRCGGLDAQLLGRCRAGAWRVAVLQ